MNGSNFKLIFVLGLTYLVLSKGARQPLSSASTRDGSDLDLREAEGGVLSGIDHVALSNVMSTARTRPKRLFSPSSKTVGGLMSLTARAISQPPPNLRLAH